MMGKMAELETLQIRSGRNEVVGFDWHETVVIKAFTETVQPSC